MRPSADPALRQLTPDAIVRSLQRGWSLFVQTRQLSVSYAMVFALIGAVILIGIVRASFAPLVVPLAGSLLLVGAVLLTGYFALADKAAQGADVGFSDVVRAYARSSAGMLAIAAVSTLLFIVWVVDVATLYGYVVGRVPRQFLDYVGLSEQGSAIVIWSSLLAGALPLLIFSVSAFSVPLLYYRRAGAMQAVRLSVLAVSKNLVVSLLWALMLSFSIVVSIVIFPLILLTFPVMAFASHALYREIFPD